MVTRSVTHLTVIAATIILAALTPSGTNPSTAVAAAPPIVGQIDLTGPAGSEDFGEQVLVLSNGNYVVIDDRFDDGGTADVGAVYLYDGMTDTVVSTLTGTTTGDRVGSGGVVEVGDSNFVVISPDWDNGAVTDVGAVTWVDGTTGVAGAVTTTNSLHGTTTGDQVGRHDNGHRARPTATTSSPARPGTTDRSSTSVPSPGATAPPASPARSPPPTASTAPPPTTASA